MFLYFGSFNPPHIGHLAIAHYVLHKGLADELWFVVSPQNPMKSPMELAAVEHRLEMMRLATARLGDGVKVSDVELSMPVPSYTYDTLQLLKSRYDDCQFTVIMGEDNYRMIGNWSRYEKIVSEFAVAVYPRGGVAIEEAVVEGNITQLSNVPTFNISSSLLREYLAEGVDVSLFTTGEVVRYIDENGLYRGCDESGDVARLLDKAKRLYRNGERQVALNLFLEVRAIDPDNGEAKVYIDLINDIYDFSYMEIYNP